MKDLATIDFNQYTSLLEVKKALDHADIQISFWGARLVTANGFNSIHLDLLAQKILQASKKTILDRNLAVPGYEIARRLRELDDLSTQKLKNVNFFTRILCFIREVWLGRGALEPRMDIRDAEYLFRSKKNCFIYNLDRHQVSPFFEFLSLEDALKINSGIITKHTERAKIFNSAFQYCNYVEIIRSKRSLLNITSILKKHNEKGMPNKIHTLIVDGRWKSFGPGGNIVWLSDNTLIPILKECRNLYAIDLTLRKENDEVTDASIEKIVNWHPNLQDLRIHGGIEITDSSLNLLALNCKNLRSIDLSSCDKITIVGLSVLAENCKELCSIFLDDGHLSINDIHDLRTKYPNLNIMKDRLSNRL